MATTTTEPIILGDLTIKLRPWPTPDPVKCDKSGDCIGVVFAGGSSYPTPYDPFLGIGEWTCAWDLDVPNIGAEADGPGWCWISEPDPLAWTEVGAPVVEWHSPWVEFPDGKSNRWIIVKIAHDGAGYAVLGLGHAEDIGTAELPTFATLDDAKHAAAMHCRDLRTRRGP
jgi:hypothetical protein